MQSLCTLRSHCRQWLRNTHYQANATPYLDRTFTGWIAPACGWRTYSITSSAVICIVRGTARLSAFAALRLMTYWNDRKIGWLLALEDAVEIRRGLPNLRQYIEVVRDHARFGG